MFTLIKSWDSSSKNSEIDSFWNDNKIPSSESLCISYKPEDEKGIGI